MIPRVPSLTALRLRMTRRNQAIPSIKGDRVDGSSNGTMMITCYLNERQ